MYDKIVASERPMRTYTIIGGINGVGKSSITGVLKEQTTDLELLLMSTKLPQN